MAYDRYAPLRAIRQGQRMVRNLPRPRSQGHTATPTVQGHTREPLYRAERRVRRRLKDQYVLRSLAEVQSYTAGVLATSVSQYPRAEWGYKVLQADDPGYRAGHLMVQIPALQLVVLHEIAHHLVGQDAAHGPRFMQAYTYLIDKEISPDVSRMLLDELSH